MATPSAKEAFKFLLTQHIQEKMDDPVGAYLLALLGNVKGSDVDASVEAALALPAAQKPLPIAAQPGRSDSVQKGIDYLAQVNPSLKETYFPEKKTLPVSAGNPYKGMTNSPLCQEWEWVREYLVCCWEQGKPVRGQEVRKVVRAAPQTVQKWIAQITAQEGRD